MDPIVLDHGSCLLKAGYANPDSDPSVLLPSSFCSTPSAPAVSGVTNLPAVPLERDVLHVLDGGKISAWDVMEDVWQYLLYDQLGWEEGNEGPLFVVEPILTHKGDRETMAQIMFEKFNVSGFFTMEAPILSLYSLGRLTGCCVDIGHTKTDIATVSDGALISSSTCRWEAGGWDMEILLGRLLAQCNPSHRKLLLHPEQQPATVQVLRQVKQQFCQIVSDPADLHLRMAQQPRHHFQLPDGQFLEVAGEGLLAAEAVFQPQSVSQDCAGLAELTLQSMTDAASVVGAGGQEADRLKTFAESIALVGGVATMPGFETRFSSELGALLPPSLQPATIKPPEYMPEKTMRFSSWIGGAIVAKIAFSQNQHVSRGEYDEKGPMSVTKKFV